MNPRDPVLQLSGLRKAYADTAVFEQVSLALAPGEFVAMLGESGVGKSTLLNCIAGLDEVDGGEILLAGQAVRRLAEPERARLRREHLGFVFQAFHLLPHLSVAENVGLPLRLLGRHGAADAATVQAMLAAVGLAALGARSPAQLSGGQLQRVALARALVHAPRLILADEPTGNLDPATAEKMIDLLQAQVRASGTACLLVTHSASAAARADRVVRLTATGIVPG
ncbi:ABC transporter ATP-binding protein [Aquabacterium sp. OR-4]|uniref:ABC transporter ATP-binding protein n=1 Tax=Aquabacterium sp. OR-4 TaxID=2978127 RepID=UPI0021B456BC|nr:ABC transporter ATP-binding protein [Aquabacterium sp. OR-4]MDT7836029.1 ABC transporter ATP-binding protein [Aquabacterium sp. OR-4]